MLLATWPCSQTFKHNKYQWGEMGQMIKNDSSIKSLIKGDLPILIKIELNSQLFKLYNRKLLTLLNDLKQFDYNSICDD